jgi:hypothetical protein
MLTSSTGAVLQACNSPALASLIDNRNGASMNSLWPTLARSLPARESRERTRAAHTHRAPAGLSVLLTVGCVSAAGQAQDQAPVTPPPGTQQLPAYMKERSGRRNPNEILWEEAMWTFFGMLVDREAKNPTSAQRMLERTIGLETDAAQKLVAHVMQAKQDERTNMLELANQQCSKVPKGTPSAESLAGMFVEMNAGVVAQRDRSVSGLFTLLDPLSQQKVRSWVDVHVRSTLDIIDTDYAMLLKKPGFDVQAVWTRLCAAEGQPKAPDPQ